ncbi:hypothetical protein D3C81_1600970 [compost metagenome]
MLSFKTVAQHGLHILFVQAVQKCENLLQLFLGFHSRFGNCQNPGEARGRQSVQLAVPSGYAACHVHKMLIRLILAFLDQCAVNFIVDPRACVDDINDDARLVIDDRVCPLSAVHNGKIGVNQFLII